MTAVMEPPPHSLGPGMQGMGEDVMRFVDEIGWKFPVVTYVEIGVSDGITLSEIAYRLSSITENWRAIGIDLPECRHETTRRNSTEKGLKFKLITEGREFIKIPPSGQVTFILKDSHAFLGEHSATLGDVHMALIDGCHGKQCASLDFLLIEPLIVPGGIVMFHDFGEDQIGQDQAPPDHCATVGVREACRDLGLLDNSRHGWHFLDTIIGDKDDGSADMGVFQKL